MAAGVDQDARRVEDCRDASIARFDPEPQPLRLLGRERTGVRILDGLRFAQPDRRLTAVAQRVQREPR